MNINNFTNHLPVLILSLFSLTVQAQESFDRSLEQQIKQRDLTIIELLERVESLEQRIGVQRQPKQTSDEQEITQTRETRAPGAIVIDEGAAERALERSLTRDGALLLPSGVLEIEPGFSYGRKEDSSPGFVTINNQILPSKVERNTINQTTSLAIRLGLPWDSQLELGLPYRRREIETVTNIGFTPAEVIKQSDSGDGDLRLGLAKTLLREGLWQPDLVGRLSWDSDSGQTGGFEEYRASFSTIKRQNPLTFIAGLSYEYSPEKSNIKPGPSTSASFGTYIAVSPETSLNFIFSATRQKETKQSGITIEGSDQNIGVFIIGGSTLLAPGTLLHFASAIGLTDDAEDYSINLSLPIRLDGRLF